MRAHCILDFIIYIIIKLLMKVELVGLVLAPFRIIFVVNLDVRSISHVSNSVIAKSQLSKPPRIHSLQLPEDLLNDRRNGPGRCRSRHW